MVRTITSLLTASFVAMLLGCGQQTDQRQESIEKEPKDSLDLEKDPSLAICRSEGNLACIKGQVISAPNIHLEGVPYFDANELGQNIEKHFLQKIRRDFFESEVLLSAKLTSPLNNQIFVGGFELFVKGAQSLNLSAAGDGVFVLDNLVPGRYTLRAQRHVELELTVYREDSLGVASAKHFGDAKRFDADTNSESKDHGDDQDDHSNAEESSQDPLPDEPNPKENPANNEIEPQRFKICGTIFYESNQLYLRPKNEIYLPIDQFQLRVVKGECRSN